MKKYLFSVVFVSALILAPSLAFAEEDLLYGYDLETASEEELKGIIALLTAKITDLARLINDIELSQSGSAFCVSIHNALYIGLNDSQTDGEVSELQRFLASTGDYDYSQITGYFGSVTKQAVKNFQLRQNIIDLGQPGGGVGPSTRAAIQRVSCEISSDDVPAPLSPSAPEPFNADNQSYGDQSGTDDYADDVVPPPPPVPGGP